MKPIEPEPTKYTNIIRITACLFYISTTIVILISVFVIVFFPMKFALMVHFLITAGLGILIMIFFYLQQKEHRRERIELQQKRKELEDRFPKSNT